MLRLLRHFVSIAYAKRVLALCSHSFALCVTCQLLIPMLVALTGASGFVGSHVADELHRRGHCVRCLLRSTSSTRWLENKPYERVACSFDSVDSLKAAIAGADAVIHTAGMIAARSLEEFMEGNRGVTQRMVEATASVAGSSFVRFVHISSLAVCGPAPSLNAPLTEESPLRPITPYGISKRLLKTSFYPTLSGCQLPSFVLLRFTGRETKQHFPFSKQCGVALSHLLAFRQNGSA